MSIAPWSPHGGLACSEASKGKPTTTYPWGMGLILWAIVPFSRISKDADVNKAIIIVEEREKGRKRPRRILIGP